MGPISPPAYLEYFRFWIRRYEGYHILGRIMRVVPTRPIEIGVERVSEASSRRNWALLNPRYSIHPSGSAMSTENHLLLSEITYWDVFCRMPCQWSATPSGGLVIWLWTVTWIVSPLKDVKTSQNFGKRRNTNLLRSEGLGLLSEIHFKELKIWLTRKLAINS